MLFRYNSYNNHLLTETAAHEERILADTREWEDKTATCFDKSTESQTAMAAEIGQIREDIDEIKGEIEKNSGN
jgi:hypothetical protein